MTVGDQTSTSNVTDDKERGEEGERRCRRDVSCPEEQIVELNPYMYRVRNRNNMYYCVKGSIY